MLRSLLLTVILSIVSFSAQAEQMSVHSVVRKSGDAEGHMVKFENGKVGFTKSLKQLGTSAQELTGKLVEAELSEDHQILNIQIIGKAEGLVSPKSNGANLVKDPFNYRPTIYASYHDATAALNTFRRNNRQEAQCYDKAHVWSYEENYYNGSRLLKVFLFFSDAYIQRYNHPWWFHTAPYALVRMNGSVNERVMDAGFYQYPLKFKLWTDLFMKNKVDCKVVTKYSDYSQHPGEDDCYVIKTHMYFWQPKDLEAFEASGIQKTKFIEWEIRHAYKEGFGMQL